MNETTLILSHLENSTIKQHKINANQQNMETYDILM